MEVALGEIAKEKEEIQFQLNRRLDIKKDTNTIEGSELEVEVKPRDIISKSTLIPGYLATSKSVNVLKEKSPNKTAKSIEIERSSNERLSRRNSKIPGAILKKL